jgi:hypothetical protein
VKYDDGDSKWHHLLMEERLGIIRWVDRPPRRVPRQDDSTPHNIVYNADTRALFMYPNICVLTDTDLADGAAFAHRLAGPPHHLYLPYDVGLARQAFVKVAEPQCLELGHTCSQQLAKLAAK